MGFFDKVRDVLTSSDAERARKGRKEAGAGSPEKTGTDLPAAGTAGPTETAGQGSGATPEDAEAPATHTVVRGDTLAAIAERYGVDRHALAELNGLDNPDLIYPGQVFRIPRA